MDSLTTKGILLALEDLFVLRRSYDICAADTILKAAGIAPETIGERRTWRLYHCVEYERTGEEVRVQLAKQLVGILQRVVPELRFYIEQSAEPAPAKPGLLRRLMA